MLTGLAIFANIWPEGSLAEPHNHLPRVAKAAPAFHIRQGPAGAAHARARVA
jgi:hypothetical protein